LKSPTSHVIRVTGEKSKPFYRKGRRGRKGAKTLTRKIFTTKDTEEHGEKQKRLLSPSNFLTYPSLPSSILLAQNYSSSTLLIAKLIHQQAYPS